MVPIDIREFERKPSESLGIEEGSQSDRVLRFLARNSDKAFTQSEIHRGTGIKRGSVGAVLSRLEDRGLVRHKGKYWAVADDDRLDCYGGGSVSAVRLIL